ncbi:protein kinase family protein [Mycobacterium sp. Marseille-P9652]|uniref:protein kinase family protein n=1 Tax=Mycobacterium sp. Marseille-P9652 TaxID=2654950 RepID=UPI0012E759F9|nr:protein kinase family protein [Mycobacterium sp. Marseille-P9652]
MPTTNLPRYWAEPHAPSEERTPLVAGSTLAGGRIRLMVFHGDAPHLEFWQALDTVTGQHLAVTVVDAANALPPATVNVIHSRTASLRGINSPGLARVLDVGRDQCGLVVVADWTRGASLKEVADTAPSPLGVADAVLPLAETADVVHGAGLALSIDHPNRIRVSADGRVVLAFPATMPNTAPRDDLRGIGAVMYALLVNRWPGRGATTEWRPVEVDAEGRIREPAALNPRVPFLISSTAAGLVRDGDGIRSAKTVSTLLREAADDAKNQAGPSTTRRLLAPVPPGSYAGFRDFGPAEKAQLARRALLKTFLGASAVVVLVMLLTFVDTIGRIMGTVDNHATMNPNKLGLHTESTKPVPSPTLVAAPPATGNGTIKPLSASVFSPGGSPDSPKSAGLAIDGDPATAWSTDNYFDAQPFPKLKEGVGLLLQLPGPTVLSAVTVDLDSTGTVAQIRSAPNATPAKLADTAELSPPTPMQPGHNVIPVKAAAPATFVVVWISTLGTTHGKNHSDISEITLQGTVGR